MYTKMTRRLSLFVFLSVFTLTLAAVSHADGNKVYIDLAGPAFKKLPMGVQEFKDLGPAPRSAEERALRESIRDELLDAALADLRFSGFFTAIDRKAYIEEAGSAGLKAEETNFRNWRTIGAQALLKGGFLVEGDRLTVEVRFFDTTTERQVIGKKLTGSVKNPRRVVHYFSDSLYEELTGSRGIFTTKILFVSGSGGNKEIYMADYDGKNAVKLTRNRSINLSPQWSPDGNKVLYVSYKRGAPYMYLLDLTTGRDEPLSVRPGVNISGRFSPDGAKVALTISGDNSPELVLLDLKTMGYRKLTNNHGIDVSPSWSPDGTKLAYVSDSAGNPHIYVLDLLSGKSRRLTFSGRYNSSPAWSPDGKLIAFARSDKGFNIWVVRPDGEKPVQLTFNGDNRSPSWAPDSRHIVYSSTVKGVSSLKVIRSDGTEVARIDTGVGGEKAPAWSPYLK